MDYNEIREKAKEILSPQCLVCKECNGLACRGWVPGVGAKGTGESFVRNYEYLKSVKVVMDMIYKPEGQDTSVSFFGRNFKAPIFVAPIGGMDINYGGKISEGEYHRRTLLGAKSAGIAAFTGDGANDDYFNEPLLPLKEVEGWGIPTLKPWAVDKVFEKIKIIEDLNVMAFAMDIDSAGLVHLAKSGKPVYSKTVEDLKAIVDYTQLPFIIKGIMSPQGALKAAESGAYGIVVSNHGGRVLDDSPATTEVLPSIREAVGDSVKIFVDGGIRTGADVFKAIALGADAVLIGRTFVIMAVGGGVEGVQLYAEKLIAELKDTMLMTGCKNISDITRDKVKEVKGTF
ncbi:MAG: alpha-hydroxy-acid oxidizing protein [Tissierellales bacterium]|nr:alpha-hydroxy-acid oxidizing protein [Tissierellales bacterium]MBN2828238.1 alpha-hydroxy-acid oxidizing protein [Tissierellales bacterium]